MGRSTRTGGREGPSHKSLKPAAVGPPSVVTVAGAALWDRAAVVDSNPFVGARSEWL